MPLPISLRPLRAALCVLVLGVMGQAPALAGSAASAPSGEEGGALVSQADLECILENVPHCANMEQLKHLKGQLEALARRGILVAEVEDPDLGWDHCEISLMADHGLVKAAWSAVVKRLHQLKRTKPEGP